MTPSPPPAEAAATTMTEQSTKTVAPWRTALKLLAAAGFAAGALSRYSISTETAHTELSEAEPMPHRRLSEVTLVGDAVPPYMDKTLQDLKDRQKLFDETPEKEIKYWFEYTGALQVGCLRKTIMHCMLSAEMRIPSKHSSA
jgi:hypothetical protein